MLLFLDVLSFILGKTLSDKVDDFIGYDVPFPTADPLPFPWDL
jgi:hypothetical protein